MDDFAHTVGEDVHFRGRSPSGERGLKYICHHRNNATQWSLPIRGAWIEICYVVRGHIGIASLPIRGAWIEMELNNRIYRFPQVAPHPGSVD